VIQYDGKSFLSTVFRLHGSVLPVLVPRIVIVGVIGAVSAFAYDEWRVAIPTIAHTLVGVALGLLARLPHERLVRPLLGGAEALRRAS
jgi:predicted membrane chloride channel (bestrophin family)